MPAIESKPNVVPQTQRDDKFRKSDPSQSRGPTASPRRIEPERVLSLSDRVDIASMDSFPCSDPPGYPTIHC
jgi:hypothetical protein